MLVVYLQHRVPSVVDVREALRERIVPVEPPDIACSWLAPYVIATKQSGHEPSVCIRIQRNKAGERT